MQEEFQIEFSDGTIGNIISTPQLTYVYILYLGNIPIYVGITDNLKLRLYQHSKVKEFDGYCVFRKSYSREDMLFVENCLIDFLSLNSEIPFLNKRGAKPKSEIIKYERVNCD
jgi:predicted GIY-YIG superfamily endonuclease